MNVLIDILNEFNSAFPEGIKAGKPTRREQAIAINKIKENINDLVNAISSPTTTKKRRTKEEIKADKIKSINENIQKLESKLIKDQEKLKTVKEHSVEFYTLEMLIEKKIPLDIKKLKDQLETLNNQD